MMRLRSQDCLKRSIELCPSDGKNKRNKKFKNRSGLVEFVSIAIEIYDYLSPQNR